MEKEQPNGSPEASRVSVPKRAIGVLYRYLLVAVLSGLLTAFLLAIEPVAPIGRYPFAYMMLIVGAAFLLGEGPAVLAFVLTWAVFTYFFVPPTYELWPIAATAEGRASQITFIGGSLVVVAATVAMRRSRVVTCGLVERAEHELAERKTTEQTLRNTSQRLDSLLEYSPLALVEWDAEYQIVRWTDEAERVFGWKANEVLGKRVTEFQFIHEEDLDEVDQLMSGMAHGQKLRSFSRNRNYRKDGTVIICEWHNSAIWDASGKLVSVLSLGLDVTAREQARAALQESEERYRHLVEFSPDGIAVHSGGQVLYMNPTAAAMVGVDDPKSLIGKQMLDFVHPDYRDVVIERISAMTAGERVPLIEEKFLRMDGSEVDVEVAAMPILFEGRKAHLVMFRDITDRVRAREAFHQAEAQKLDFYRRTILAATEGKLVITEAEEIEKLASGPVNSWEIATGEDLSRVRHDVAERARGEGMEESQIDALRVSVGEATTNALKHAGRGTVSLSRVSSGLMVVVRDDGPGIDAMSLPEVALTRGYSTSGTLGMGYKVMTSFCDKVYLATGPQGTVVGLQMSLEPRRDKPSALDLIQIHDW